MLSRYLLPAVLVAGSAQAGALSDDQFLDFPPEQIALGQLLFYDKVVSGNKNISCATCHHHDLAGADGLSLGIGEGGVGLGTKRTPGSGEFAIEERIPRNAPALWNIGHKSVQTLFHDGRVSVNADHPSGFNSPAGDLLPKGLESVVAVQALFPLSSGAEMAGHETDNEVAHGFNKNFTEGWDYVVGRLKTIDAYEPHFVAAFDHINTLEEITITDVGNAIGAFVATEWRNFDSPYDAFLTDGTPLPPLAEEGRQLFFGDAGCAACHSGPLLTNHDFYAIGLPQFGPGKPQTDLVPRDLGRSLISGNPEDAYKFRTPGLRNVALTGPYGHNGAYTELRDMIQHMANPEGMLEMWEPKLATLPDVPWLKPVDFLVQGDATEVATMISYVDVAPVRLSSGEIDAIEAFLHALTGKTAWERPLGRPETVPSGLPVD